ncbi:MAG: phenylacetate-CoA oxygenase subunit PaaC [Ramlibacter sp.]|nr:phenylacetate-CoA oxygenase subunit PaaC [Ramlibacter sp.]
MDRPPQDAPVAAPLDYLLHLADNALVLGQRNAEWCGHGPALEEDIAMANIGLDLIGQARLLYQHAATLAGPGATEDSLAYFRDAGQFRNFTLLELPHHGPLAGTAAAERDYATTIARNFLYSAFMLLRWQSLQDSGDAQLAAIAAKSLKETRYHLRHARDWLVRLGDGTAESRARMQAALDHLMPYTQEFWTRSDAETAALESGAAADPGSFRQAWEQAVAQALAEAGLQPPPGGGHVSRGKQGLHSEHLSYLLAEMQGLARQHPGASW